MIDLDAGLAIRQEQVRTVRNEPKRAIGCAGHDQKRNCQDARKGRYCVPEQQHQVTVITTFKAKQLAPTDHMTNTTEVCGNRVEARNGTSCFVAGAFLGIPILLMCSCTHSPVEHYTLAPKGSPGSAEEAIFSASEQPAIRPCVKIDGHYFSTGSKLVETVIDPLLQPFAESQTRSFEVRLLPGPHKVDVAIDFAGSCSLHFSDGRTINFQADAGKSYELQVKILRFKDQLATGNIEWGTKIVEVETQKEFASDPGSSGQL
jgi:hypothetical protein